MDMNPEQKTIVPDEGHYIRDVLSCGVATAQSGERCSHARPALFETVKVLAGTIESRISYMRGHCERVCILAVALAVRLDLSAPGIEVLEYASLLHDIGIIAVPEAVLVKPGELTEDERRIVGQHPVIAAQILSPIEFFAPCLVPIRQHHERWDGHGYPEGLADEAIHPLARIIAVCDTFDAMASGRPYKPAVPLAGCIAEISACRGSQFAPEVVDAFLGGRIYEHYPERA